MTPPPTPATRAVAFPLDEAVGPAERRAAEEAAAGMAGLRSADWRCGPTLRCRQTASAVGAMATVEAALDECDHGSWRGLSLAEVAAADPAGLRTWLTDPDAAPHGGESVRDQLRRVAGWLDGLVGTRIVAVTHPSVVRAVLVHVLNAPARAFWRLDVAPLTRTDLSGRAGTWTVRRTAERLLRRG